MAFVPRSKEGEESSEKSLVDLSFYKIASRIGTSGGILSMWLSERAKPGPEELDAIEKFLKG